MITENDKFEKCTSCGGHKFVLDNSLHLTTCRDCMGLGVIPQEKLYAKITVKGGSSYIQKMEDLASALDGEFDGCEEGSQITITIVKMTDYEYELLPEFQGH